MKIYNYTDFIKENKNISSNIPTYDECVEMCSLIDSPFYEIKTKYDGYNISIFNYRLAQWSDFEIDKRKELRGLTFVFNTDGSLYNRYLLLEKFFNLNQVPESMYSVVKDFKIKHINNKEDGSIASFIKLPNGKVLGKSKMGLDKSQAIGIGRIYKSNNDIKYFVNWCLNNNISPIFEYVAPSNKIVLRYKEEELILLRLRNNTTGQHIDIKDHLDKIGSIKIAPFDDDKTLDSLIELSKTEEDKEGWVVQFDNGRFVKIKTQWYMDRHGLLTNDLYRENIIIGYILDDKIDDILGQIPEDEKEAHLRINKIIAIVKKALNDKVEDIEREYSRFVNLGITRKEYAINHRKNNANFSYVMNMVKLDELKNMTDSEILDRFDSKEEYNTFLENSIEAYNTYEMAKTWLYSNTNRLNIAREWLREKDPTMFFKDQPDDGDDE